MYFISIVIARFVVRSVASLVAAFLKVIKGDPAKSLCLQCANAHIAIGQRANQRMTNCTYGGEPRAVKFVVSDCSMFCSRNAPGETVQVIGFAAFTQDLEQRDALIAAKASE